MDDDNPKLICEDCVRELAMVAKFHDKCQRATDSLDQLREEYETRNTRNVMLNVEIIDSATMKAEEGTGGHLLTETDLNDDDESDMDAVEYITEQFPQEGFDYVVIDDSPVDMGSFDGTPNDDCLIEETDDDLAVATEYFCPETEDNADDSQLIPKIEEVVDDIPEDLEGIIRTQIERARRRKIEFGSPSSNSKMNINHFCKMCGAG